MSVSFCLYLPKVSRLEQLFTRMQRIQLANFNRRMLKRLGFSRTCTLLDKIMAANQSGYMTRSKSFTPQVQHDIENENFFIDIDASRAFLSYNKIDKILVMEHTEVPPQLGGKGLGKSLAKVCLTVNGFAFVVLAPVHLLTYIFLLSCSLPLITVLKMAIKCN